MGWFWIDVSKSAHLYEPHIVICTKTENVGLSCEKKQGRTTNAVVTCSRTSEWLGDQGGPTRQAWWRPQLAMTASVGVGDTRAGCVITVAVEMEWQGTESVLDILCDIVTLVCSLPVLRAFSIHEWTCSKVRPDPRVLKQRWRHKIH